jgi:molybdate transport system substrate-binding protein
MVRATVLLLAPLVASSAWSHEQTTPAPTAGPAVRIAAAADLAFAAPELATTFEAKTGHRVEVLLGSSGQFAKQMSEGAPFDVFASANVQFVDDAVRDGDCDGATRSIYGQGRLVMWTSTEYGAQPPTDLEGLTDPSIVKIAIANPEHAPYGKAAKQALERAGVWTQVEKKIVYGENVRQTMQYAQSGNVEVAIIALALALPAHDGRARPIDTALHEPIDQAMAVCARDSQRAAVARAFMAFVASPAGTAIMERFGFVVPGEA